MTRKHFQAIADVLRDAQSVDASPRAMLDIMATGLADVCREANGRFDRDRFYRACGLDHLAAN